MLSYPLQGGRLNTRLQGGERGQSKSQENVYTCRWSSTPPRVRWSSNLLGLPLPGGVQFKLRPQVGPLSLRGGGPGTLARVCQADPSEAMTGGARGVIG